MTQLQVEASVKLDEAIAVQVADLELNTENVKKIK